MITFQVNEKEKCLKDIEALKDQKLAIDAEVFREKRSLDANKYLWKLCTLIADKIGSDKDTVYLMFLKDADVFVDIDVVAEAVNQIKPFFRLCEEQYRYTTTVDVEEGYEEYAQREMVNLRCYYGSHTYDSKQMHKLLEAVISEANHLGISTITDEEMERISSSWKAREQWV